MELIESNQTFPSLLSPLHCSAAADGAPLFAREPPNIHLSAPGRKFSQPFYQLRIRFLSVKQKGRPDNCLIVTTALKFDKSYDEIRRPGHHGTCTRGGIINQLIYSVDSRFAPSQWQTALQSNDVSYWLGANLESALNILIYVTQFFVKIGAREWSFSNMAYDRCAASQSEAI